MGENMHRPPQDASASPPRGTKCTSQPTTCSTTRLSRHGRIEETEPHLDFTKLPKYITDDDFPLCTACQRHPPKYDGWSQNVVPEGKGGARLIGLAMSAGRLYYQHPSARRATDYQPIQPGPPRQVDPGWENLPHGDATPTIDGLPPDAFLLYVDPPAGLIALYR